MEHKATDTWHWVKNGGQRGPATTDEMKSYIAYGEVKPETRVWGGEGDWVEARHSALAPFFTTEPAKSGPPPLRPEEVDNKYVWMVALVPVVGMLAELLSGQELIWLYAVLNIAILLFDEYKLKKAGHAAPVKWWIFLVPVYLWKRAEMLGQSKNYFAAWMVMFFLSFPLHDWVYESLLAESACPLVTEIAEQYGSDLECKRVEIESEISSGFYKGTATMSDGDELKITIEDMGKEIQVRVKGS